MDKNEAMKLKKCITPPFRVSFPAVFKPKSFQNQEPKFSVVMLFDKKTDLSKLRSATMVAITEKWGADKAKWPKNMRSPFRDGDERRDVEGYTDTIFVTATSKKKPGVVDASGKIPLEEATNDFYAGCYARASIIAFAYGGPGTPYTAGVSFSLQNLQKLRDGTPFSGRKDATEEFDAVEDLSGGNEEVDPFAAN